MKFTTNTRYECIKSHSPAYKEGKVYTTYSKDNKIYFKGDDGLEDLCSNMISKFKKVMEKKDDQTLVS